MDSQAPQQPTTKGVNLSVKTTVLSAVALLAVGAAIGRFGTPAKVVTKTVTQTVYKEAEVKNTEDQKNTVTTITQTTKPDGTKIQTTVIADKDDIKTVDSTKINSTTDTTSTTTTTYSKNNWNISALAEVSPPSLTNLGPISYGVEVDRRIIGPISVGAFGFTNRSVGLSLGISL
jgi:hypothetical protein